MISPRSLCLRSLVIVPLKRLSSDSKAIQEFELYQRDSEGISNDTERYGSDFDATPKAIPTRNQTDRERSFMAESGG